MLGAVCLAASAVAAPTDALCEAGGDDAAINCYVGSFLLTVLTKINNADARTAEHQREALLFYLGGDKTLQALRTDSQEDTNCIACTSSPTFSRILYDVRADLTAEQRQAYDGLHVNYPMLTHIIYDALPKTPDFTWLRPDGANDPLAQTQGLLALVRDRLSSAADDAEAVGIGAAVSEDALCDGSELDLAEEPLAAAGRAAILCYAGTFLSSLFGKLNSGLDRSSEHVRKALLLYLANSDAAVEAASRETMEDKACTLCYTAPTLASHLAAARDARSDSERRSYSAAAAAAGLSPARLTELVWARLPKTEDGIFLRADARFGGDAPSQAAATLRSVFAAIDATTGAAAPSVGAGGCAAPSVALPNPYAVALLLGIALALCAAALRARQQLGDADFAQALGEIFHGPAAHSTPPQLTAGGELFVELGRNRAEERRIKGRGADAAGGPGATPTTAAAMLAPGMLRSDEPPADSIFTTYDDSGVYTTYTPGRPRLLSEGAARGLRRALLLLGGLFCIAAGGALFGGAAPPAAGAMMAGTVLADLAPASHVFSHGAELIALREFRLEVLQLPTNVGELDAAEEQTHEIYFEPATRAAFVSVVTSSRLLQLPFDASGALAPSLRSWVVGHPEHNEHPELGALHNVAGSHRYPGSLWLSTEGDDRVYLVDPHDGFRVRYQMHVPTSHVDATGAVHRVGGPHSVREAPDGTVWVCLKGANPGEGPQDAAHEAYNEQMMAARFAANGEPVPDGYAVWHIDPDAYDGLAFPAKGGVMYDALPSPTMTAIDGLGNAWHTQDKSPKLLHVSAAGVATQVALPTMGGSVALPTWSFASGNGPGIVTDPAGAVWLCNLVPGQPWIVRFAAGSTDPLVFRDLGSGEGDGSRHVIHLAFSSHGGTSGRANVLYALTSALLAPGATESVIMLEMDDKWERAKPNGEVGRQEIVLPSRNSAAHRIAVVDAVEPHSILVTGLLTNTVFQIMGPGI